MDNFQLVVGSKECPINTVVSTIQPSLISNKWSTLARGLNIGSEHVKKFRQDLLLDKITSDDVICEVLELWVGQNGSSATLGKLLNVVEEQCGANDVGESLRLDVGLPCKAADGNPSIDWEDISPAFQNLIIENFQKFFPTLKFSETLPNLKGPSLIKLMTGKKPPLFVHPFPDTQRYYINRTLITRNIISKKIFEQNSEDIFLFTGMDPSELSALAGNKLTGSSSEQLRYSFTVKFMILDRAHHFETICEKTDDPVHLLTMEDDGRLRWISSKGRMSNLQKYVDQLQDKFDEAAFCEHLDSQATSVLICDSPGMGKSVLLAQIGSTLSQLYPDRTVLFIGLTEFIKLVRSIDKKDEVKRIEIALQNLTGEPILQSNLNLEETAVVSFELLLDGFDELDSADYKLAQAILHKISISFKSTRLWVTSRPHLMEELETSLNFLGFNIRPFNEQDQIKFLSTFWSRKELLDEERSELFAQKCLKSLKSKMDSRSQDIAGIPLQCLLIGEVYEKDVLKYARMGNESSPLIGIEIGTITNLYQRLIGKKIEKYKSLSDNLSEAKLMEIHAQLGLKLLFPGKMETLIPDENDIAESLKVGIIVKSSAMDSPFAFMHRTFAEYFVAWFVVDKLRWELLEREWTVNVNDFFLHCILKCQGIKYYEYVENDFIKSFEFAEPVICFFLNSFIADLKAGNDSSPIRNQLNGKNPELMNTIVRACANHDFVHIFKLFHERYKFDEYYKTKIFTIDFLLHSIRHSSLELVKPIVYQLELDDKFNMEEQAKALSNAVRQGKFSIVEFLIKEKQLYMIVKDLSYGTGRLVHDCITISDICSDEEIGKKIQVFRMLIRINGSLLNGKVDGRAPLLFDHVHVKLLKELVRLGADVFAEDEHGTVLHFTLGRTVLHLYDNLQYRRILSSSDYHLLLMSFPDESLQKLVHKKAGEEEHTPLTSALKWIDPAPETLDMFHRVGADFKYTTPTGSSLLEFAIINGRSAVTIRKIIQHGDIKVLGHKRAKTFSIMRCLRPCRSTNLLHTAAKWGNVEAVGVLVDEYGIDVNSKNEHGRTPLDLVIRSNNGVDRFKTGLALKERRGRFKDDKSLIVAATNRNIQSVRLLISLGVDVNGMDEQENTALHKYLEPKDEDYIHKFAIVQLFVDNGADLTALNNIGNTPFHTAMKNENLKLQIFQLLKSKTDEISSWTPSLCSLALQFAIQRYSALDEEEFISILNNLCNLHQVNVCLDDDVGNFAVHVAADQGRLRSLQLLVEKGADLNMTNNLGNTPLHVAINKGYLKTVQLLVEKEADLNMTNNLGETPLHVAINNGYPEIVRFLVHKGADLNVKNNWGETPLHVAINKGYLRIVQLLVENEADLNVKNNLGNTPLHVAVNNIYVEIPQLLVKNRADLNVKNNLGNTPLHVASNNGYLEFVQLLVEKGADLNMKNNLGETPLHVAINNGYLKIAQLLVEKGADLNVKNNLGETPLHVAINKGYLEIPQFLVEKGADLNVKNNLGETPLHVAINKGYLADVQFLVEKGADLNVKNNLGNTSLHVVVSCKLEYTLLSWVSWLIENGADAYTKNNDDHTILRQYILTTPSPSAFHSIVKYLIEADLINLFNIPGGCCMENGYNCGALPLQLAVYKLEPEIETLELLQSNKINFNAVDELGHSILFNALNGRRSLKFISTLITQFQVDWKIIDREGCSILHHAVEDVESDYLKFFLELGGLNVNEVNDKGETPLFCAASDKKNVFKKCKMLVDYGADANISNKAGLTPLDLIKRGPSRVDKWDLEYLLCTSQHLKQ